MIPKVIHYCWFGGNPLPELAKRCIESWKKYCPEYEIKEWNEKNFDVECCDYVKEAYEAKKWAFVSDYARFKILYENGGVYFDTDVELVKGIDELLQKGAFMGVEREIPLLVNPGLGLAAEKGMELYLRLIKDYDNRHFLLNDGKYNLKTIVEYTTEVLNEYGLVQNTEIQYIANIYIYPKEYFNPYDSRTGKIKIKENTISIHHFAASWLDPYTKFRRNIYFLCNRLFGEKVTDFIRKVFGRRKRG